MQDLCTEKNGNIVERNVFKKPKKMERHPLFMD